jgi:ABC-2 type transport system ATP-binding protein
MSEMAMTAEHLIVIGRGTLIADMPAAEFIARSAPGTVRVRSASPAALAAALRGPGVTVAPAGGGALTVTGLTTDQVALTAQAAGVTVLELTAQQASLEEAFVDLTRDAVEYRTAAENPGASR